MSEIQVPRLLPITKASTATGLSYKLLRQLCDENRVPHLRSGNRLLINIDALIEFLNRTGGERG